MLMRFDPFRELDRLFGGETQEGGRTLAMPMDAYRQGDEFVVQFDMPGIDPSSIDMTVEKNVLTVRADRSGPSADGQEWLVSERPKGVFSRQLFLGEGLDVDHVQATYDAGVLTVRIPVAEQAKPRKVPVIGSSEGQSITAESTEAKSSAAA